MALRAVLIDLDDTLIVDEAVSREAFQAVARYARDQHGAEEERFARDAAEQAKALWLSGPCKAFCRNLGISAFECLWGRFEGEGELGQLRKWALGFREQVFDHALRQQMIESAEGSRDLAEAFSTERRLLQRLMPDALETLDATFRTVRAGYADKWRAGLAAREDCGERSGESFQGSGHFRRLRYRQAAAGNLSPSY